jgi:hypothetical protein
MAGVFLPPAFPGEEKNMSAALFIIECGRCGLTALEPSAESEAMAARDAIGPLMRHCAQCGRTTGWLPWRRRSNDDLLNSGPNAARPVPSGQERLASQSELAAVRQLLQQRKLAHSSRTDDYDHSRTDDYEDGLVGNDKGINRFLLCTIVWGVARKVKAEGETNGERMPLQRIAREVLSSYLKESVLSGRYLLAEKALDEAIKRRLAELFNQSRVPHAEEGQFNIGSLVAAEHTKRKCRNVKH